MPQLLSKRWLRCLLALGCGPLITLSLAPFNLWLFAPLACALLYWLLQQDSTPRQGLLTGWLFGFGLFASGTSWVYVSIHDYGSASPVLAGLLTLLFVAGLALFQALHGWLWVRFLRGQPQQLRDALAFAALWVVSDAFRGWFLTAGSAGGAGWRLADQLCASADGRSAGATEWQHAAPPAACWASGTAHVDLANGF